MVFKKGEAIAVIAQQEYQLVASGKTTIYKALYLQCTNFFNLFTPTKKAICH
jgi:alpha-D-ribose 1-methylphosphonate 5-triphosphate diphosphatase PhnM